MPKLANLAETGPPVGPKMDTMVSFRRKWNRQRPDTMIISSDRIRERYNWRVRRFRWIHWPRLLEGIRSSFFRHFAPCLWALVSPRSRFDVSRDREKIFLIAQSEEIILDISFERWYRFEIFYNIFAWNNFNDVKSFKIFLEDTWILNFLNLFVEDNFL